MTKQRLEAFTDGVVAIIITIMVLDMKVPAGSGAVRTNEGDMTRYVLLVGALFAGLFTLMWPVFTLLPSLPDTGVAPFDSILHSLRIFAAINGYNEHSPFTGTGPVFKLW